MITTCLDELALRQPDEVLDCLTRSKFKGVDDSLDYTLLKALCECCKNANNWSKRRQVLSILVGKIGFNDLKKWIPDLTWYRVNIARHHWPLYGTPGYIYWHSAFSISPSSLSKTKSWAIKWAYCPCINIVGSLENSCCIQYQILFDEHTSEWKMSQMPCYFLVTR